MKSKILTIGIPVYNTEAYLERCLQSILFDEVAGMIEVIAVNDGSTDNSLEILREWQKRFPESMKIIDKKNEGYGSTVNCAAKAATGKYFKLLDSDDWYDKDNFPTYLEVLKDTEADVIVNRVIDEHSTFQNFDKIRPEIEYGKTLKFENIKWNEVVIMHCIAYKTTLLQKNYRDVSKQFYADNEYIIYPLISNMNTFLFLDLFIYHYFIGREGQSIEAKSRIRNFQHMKNVTEGLLDFVGDIKEKLSNEKRNYLQNFVYSVVRGYWMLLIKNKINITDKEKKALLKECIKRVKTNDYEIYKKMRQDIYIKFYFIFPTLYIKLTPLLNKAKKSIK